IFHLRQCTCITHPISLYLKQLSAFTSSLSSFLMFRCLFFLSFFFYLLLLFVVVVLSAPVPSSDDCSLRVLAYDYISFLAPRDIVVANWSSAARDALELHRCQNGTDYSHSQTNTHGHRNGNIDSHNQ